MTVKRVEEYYKLFRNPKANENNGINRINTREEFLSDPELNI
jgi:hypothetical protein